MASIWDETAADLEHERLSDPLVRSADAASQAFKAQRSEAMATQQEVCWLQDHFSGLTFQQVADLLGVERPLVSRYANLQKKQREFNERIELSN